MNLRNLTDDQLHTSTIAVAAREREETISLLKHLSEVERRHLYSKFKCDSLHAYCVDRLKMSDPQAGRRVSASRLLNELPMIEDKVRAGSMTLTSVSQAGTFFRKEAVAGNNMAREQKLALIAELEGQATRHVEKILLSKSDQPSIHLRESIKQKTVHLTEIKVLIDDETLTKLNRLKEICSHEMPNATFAQLVAKLADIGLKKLAPDLKAKRALERKLKVETGEPLASSGIGQTPAPECKSAPKRRSRFIPAAVKHAVWRRDRGCCTFVDKAGDRCESRRFVEYDHLIPFVKGGEQTVINLRLRCRAHNQRHAIETLGFNRAFCFPKRTNDLR